MGGGRFGLAVAFWLVKEEPRHYSWTDLEREGGTEWDGVHNALALRNLKSMGAGDRAIFYHSGDERSCIGILEVVGSPHPDPRDARGSWSVEVRPVRPLRRPIPLAEVKADPALLGFDLIRLGRLSVVAVSDDQWARLLAHEDATPVPARPATEARAGRARRSARRRRPRAARRRR
ncbi:MAG TPA: EVE domain-containing protein [Thermoplasmata archaeon]|nr:EVE domain-containing protein [Thermoplasmata archaeon]